MNKKTIWNIVLTIIVGAVFYYFLLPPLNLSSPDFWTFLFLLFVIYLVIGFTSKSLKKEEYIREVKSVKDFYVPSKKGKICALVILGVLGCILLINFACSPLFQADKYAKRITIDETTEFTKDVAPVDFQKIALLDRDSSSKLGDRKMGQMSDLVSQFEVDELYTQINYNNEIVRVTPLEYASFIKYFTNRKNGVAGYITVNSVSGDANLVRLEKGMRYMPSALFFENLHRKLRLAYPTEIFREESFEIDNEGHPYWIVPTVHYVGVGMREEIDGVVILDAVTGKSKKYDIKDVPTWVDHVYAADLIIEQVDQWGEYKNGFFNSIFGQKNVVNTTSGYNYTVMNDDVYLYTGITSVSNDESILGFIMSNMRTKETHFYSAPGAEEYSAMASAQGLVQEKEYIASFPLLINLNNRPTYLLSLKDNADLVKMYAFVDVADYQKVVTNDASLGISAAAKKYLSEAGNLEPNDTDMKEKTIVIKNITTATIDGNTHYYITDTKDEKYMASIKAGQDILPFVKVGNELNIKYQEGTNTNQIFHVE